MLTYEMEQDWLNSRGVVNMAIEWTEQEKRWLENRAAFVERDKEAGFYCTYCTECVDFDYCLSHLCPTDTESVHNLDAAEFEARVAKKLAEKIPLAMRMAQVKHNDFVMDAEIALKLARLDVEEDMENEQC